MRNFGDEDFFPSHCVVPRCALCRQTIDDGDQIVAMMQDGRQSAPFLLPFRDKHVDRGLMMRFDRCTAHCGHNVGQVTGCHVPCLDLMSKFERPVASMIPAARHSYSPHVSEEKYSYAGSIGYLERLLHHEVGKLPPELWGMVAPDLLRSFSVTTLAKAPKSANCEVDLFRDIWATYLVIDGLRYVTRVSNDGGDELVSPAVEAASSNDTLHVLEDHLGIRQVIVSRNDAAPPPFDHGHRQAWWRSVPITNPKLEFKSDGVKLRGIAAPWMNRDVLWSVPVARSEMKTLLFHTFASRSDARMVPLPLNDPEVTGYSAVWSQGLNYLHAHRAGESLDFYRDIDASQGKPLWSYMPLWPGEHISQMWIRQGMLGSDIALAFKTNTGRVMKTGSFSSPGARRHMFWNSIAQSPPSGPSRIFFSYSKQGVHQFATPRPSRSQTDPAPVDKSLTPFPNFYSVGPIFHSGASLEGVKEVVVCRLGGQDGLGQRVSGLLLRYANGNEISLGSYRLDCAKVTLPVSTTESPALFLGLRRGKSQWTVQEVEVSSPCRDPESPLEWKEYPWAGSLEWWFRVDECLITHTFNTNGK